MVDMLKTTKEMIRALKKEALIERKVSGYLSLLDQPQAQKIALILERSSSKKFELAEKLKSQFRLNTLSVYTVNMEKTVRKGKTKTYTYWYASWRFDKKVKNVYLGSAKTMNRDMALSKAKKLKTLDLSSASQLAEYR
jgi:hypothetical protein